MEVVMGALPSVLSKLGELLISEYKLQKRVKVEIMFVQAELESMKGALVEISKTSAEQLYNQDKIWSKKVRELSYDIEDSVDTFVVRVKGSEPPGPHGFKLFIERSCNLLTQYRVRRSIANEIRDIKTRIVEVCERRERYKINTTVTKPVRLDPRLFVSYMKATELVGIDKARNQVIKILMGDNEVFKQQDKIVSIVGFGGLGKTTLANVVYENLKGQFDCSAFVSVSQTPDMVKVFKGMLHQLDKGTYGETWDEGQLMREIRELLLEKRYLIFIDDLWDIMQWKMIKCALPDSNVGCKMITTTRILSVAQEAGFVYKMKPLSPQNSRKLLYRRIFGNKDKGNSVEPERCPDEELTEVSDRILRKCAGVPLAIITIGSLLASKERNKMEWYEVCNSIGTGMEDSLDAQNMRKILSYSYYDLPSHLKTCLLYLSMLPEDFEIRKDRLIWLWIAEGFTQHEEHGKGLFVLGESYFNELINRGMIQPVDDFGVINRCRVHDMVLDLIRSLSTEENFVTTLSDDMDHTSSVRRLSLQNSKVDHATAHQAIIKSMPRVRSVVAFPSCVDQIPALGSFKVLRVLDIQGCDLSKGYSLKYLGNLFHLRYLSLKDTGIDKLPEEVGNLQFLETLDVRNTNVSSLPSTVIQLKKLLCLSISWNVRVPNGIRNLRSLEELSWLGIDDDSIDCVEELYLLTELRVLCICLLTDKCNNKLVACLHKLRKIQRLEMFGGQCNMGGLDAWVAPRHLQRLDILSVFWFSMLPTWMNNPSHLRDLSLLRIAVREIQQEDLQVIGRLPALCDMFLKVDHEDLGIIGRYIVDAGSFPCLVRCQLRGFVGPVVFQQGAMPRLTTLEFEFHVREEIASSDGGFDLGLMNLPSLQYVGIRFGPGGARKQAEAALKQTAEIHPNRPRFRAYKI